MNNLTDYAKRELELLGAFDKEKDFYGGMTGKAVLELIELFSKQGHSGMSAGIVRQLFTKLSDFKPLSPLTFSEDEWRECDDCLFQNKRNSSVFKKGKKGLPYTIEAYYMKNQDGCTCTGSLSIGDGRRVRRCYIKDPAKMPEICIDTIDWEVDKDDESKLSPGSGWWLSKMKDIGQLEELKKFYNLEIISEE